MEGVLAAFAQFDNDVRAERTRAGMRTALEQGRWTFIPPVGYLNAPKWTGKSLMPDPDRGALVTRAFEEFATGRFTKEEVLDSVTRLGLRTRIGSTMNPQSFGRMLTNRLYTGFIDMRISACRDVEISIRSCPTTRSTACRRFCKGEFRSLDRTSGIGPISR
jgi:hypothetical protein